MSFSSRQAALHESLEFLRIRGVSGDNHEIGQVLAHAEQVHDFLVADGDPGVDSNTIADQLAAVQSDLERLITMTVDISQAESDFAAAVAADTTAKQALQQQVSDLTAQVATLQAADLSDQAATAAAVQQVADAASALETGAQALNPLPAPPAPTPDPTPVTPTS